MFRTFIFDSNNKLIVKGDVTIDDGLSNTVVLQSDSNDLNSLRVNGNAKITSNVYALNRLGVGTSNPTERVHVIDNIKGSSNLYIAGNIAVSHSNPSEKIDVVGNAKVSSNLYVANAVGVANSNPSEKLDISGNAKVSLNMYILSNVAIAHSNPTEKLDVIGNVKVSSNIYVSHKVGINTSNPAVGLEVNTSDAVLISKGTTSQRPSAPILGHIRYNTETSQFEGFGAGSAWGSLGGVKSTNQQTFVSAEEYPTSNDDNIRFVNSNIESMRITRNRLVGINTSNPTERLEIVGNTKITSNVYILNRVGINTSNPNVGLEVNTTDAVLISKGTTSQRPSAPVLGHVRYNTETSQFEGFGAGSAWGSLGGVKSTNQQTFVSAEEYPTSNDDNIRFVNSNIESMRITRSRLVGINTSNPTERVDIVGNIKVSSNAYVLNRLGINTSNPAVGLEVNTTDAILISKGTTAQRPSAPILGHVRYNTETSQFEGFGAGSAWGSLGGVKSTNQQTFVSAEEYPTSNDDNIRFVNSNIESMRITRNRLVGINTSNPTERLEVNGNVKITSNLYVNTRIGVGTSNPQSPIEVIGDIKSTTINTSNVSTSNFTTSNARTCNLEVNTILASNIVTSNLVIVNSNITTNNVTADETVNSSNIFTSNLFASRRIGVGTSNPQFTFEVQGNAYISGATILSNSLNVTGPMTLCNNLNVSGPMTLCNTLNVSGATLLSNTLLAYGATTLSNTVTIAGATTLSNTLNVSGQTVLSNALTTYNGTTTHSNAVIVSGVTTLSNNLNVSGPMTLSNTINVSGAALLSNTLIAYGPTTLSNTVTISGATTLSNTLNVSGATVLSNALTTYNGPATFSNNVVVSGITTLSNALNVSGATTMSNSLNVSGVTVLSNALTTYNGTTTHSNAVIVSGITTLSNNLNVSGTMTLCNTMNVSGATVLSNAFTTYNGPSTFSNNVIVSGSTTLSNNLNVSGPMTLSNTLNVSGATLMSNTLIAYGATTLSNTVTISGATTLSNTLNVSGTTILSNALITYNGPSTFSNNVIVSGTTTLSNALNVSGATTLSNTINVSGAALLSNTLTTYGATTLSNTVIISGATTLSNTLNVSGATLLSNGVTVYNGTSTFSNNIITSGNVGIGTNAPNSKLDVRGAIYVDGATGQYPSASFASKKEFIKFGTTDGSSDYARIYAEGATDAGKLVIAISDNMDSTEALVIRGEKFDGTTSDNLVIRNDGLVGIGTSSNMTEKLHVSGGKVYTDQQFLGNSNDSAAVPSFSFKEDSNTGMFHASNDAIGFTTSATERMRINAFGQVGIGTTTPSEMFEVASNAKIGSNLYVVSRLGVNTSNPSQAIHVVGNVRVEGNLDVNGIYNTINTDVQVTDQFTVSNNGTGPALNVYQMGAQPIADFYDDSNLAMRIADGGNVGIGPSNPSYKLDVFGTTKIGQKASFYGASAYRNLIVTPLIGQQATELSFEPLAEATGSNAVRNYIYTDSNGLSIGTSTGGNTLFVGSNSRLGVGTTTPTYKMDVSGTSRLGNTINATYSASFDNVQYTVRNYFTATGAANSAHIYRIILMATSTNMTGSAHYIIPTQYNATGGAWQVCLPTTTIGFWSTNSFELQMSATTGGVQSFRVVRKVVSSSSSGTVMMNVSIDYPSSITPTLTDNTGDAATTDSTSYAIYNGTVLAQYRNNVGINTSNPTYTLDVSGNINATTGGRINAVYVGIANISGQGTWIHWNRDGGSGYTTYANVKGGGSGGHVFGEATTANVFTEYMRLSGGGSLGVGTNSPSEKLDINGGNFKVSSNAYVMSRLGVNTSNPGYALDVAGNVNFTGTLNQNGVPYIASQWSNNSTNVFLLSSNVGIGTSNPAYLLDVSGTINATTYVGATITSLSNLGIFGSNTAISASNTVISLSNYIYTTETTNIAWASNAGLFGSNTAVSASNTTISLSNYVYGTNTSNISWASNAAVFGSNTSVSASNTVISLSNYVYGNSSTNIAWTSNAATFGSNTSVWTSNNMFNKAGGTISGNTIIQGTTGLSNTVTVYARNATNGAEVAMNSTSGSGGRDFRVVSTLSGNAGGAGAFQVYDQTATTARLHIDSNGNVGIGTTTPTYKLDVSGDINFTGVFRQNGVPYIGSQWSNNSSNIFVFGSNIGIGTSNAVENITVIGGKIYSDTQILASSNDSSNAPSFAFKEDSNTGLYHPSNDTLGFVAGGVETFRITPGQFTINSTLDIASNLSVGSNISASGSLFLGNRLVLNSLKINRKQGLDVNVTQTKVLGFSNASNGIILDIGSNAPASNQSLRVTWSNNTELMRIRGDGNLGLGTTTPLYKLDINGNTPKLRVQSSTNTSGQDPTISLWNTTKQVLNVGYSHSGFYTYIQNSNTDIIRVYDNSNTYFSSNVGIKVTAPTYSLDVSGDINFTGTLYKSGATFATSQWTSSSSNIYILSSNVGIGTTGPVHSLETNGSIMVANNNTYISLNANNLNASFGMIKKSGVSPSFAFTSNFLNTTVGNSMRFEMISGAHLSNMATETPVEHMRLTNAGFLGIGTTSPTQRLDVSGNIRATSQLIVGLQSGQTSASEGVLQLNGNNGSTGNWRSWEWRVGATSTGTSTYNTHRLRLLNNSTENLTVDDSGNVGINTTAPSERLNVNGNILASGNITAYSDARAKSNLEVITNPLDKVAQLHGYTYEMFDNPDLTTKITPRFTGIIAQELEKVLPEAVHKDAEGKYSVAYGNMAGLFIESIKELTKENTELKQKVITLEDRLAKIEAFMSSMV